MKCILQADGTIPPRIPMLIKLINDYKQQLCLKKNVVVYVISVFIILIVKPFMSHRSM